MSGVELPETSMNENITAERFSVDRLKVSLAETTWPAKCLIATNLMTLAKVSRQR